MTALPPDAALLLRGRVMHARLRPKPNRFSYRVFCVRLRVRDIDAAQERIAFDRLGLTSFRRRDHGARDGRALEPWIRGLLAAEGIDGVDGDIWLQTFPRVLGYVFNPVSFWLCHDRAGGLRAVLCEVNNTFGDRHNYLLARDDGHALGPADEVVARKVFHVSPFCAIAGEYRFRFDATPAATRMRIDYDDGDGRLLVTSISGRAEPLTAAAIVRCFFSYPWMTLGVIVRIHWQALRLWAKGLRFHPRPQPPVRETTR